MSKWISMIVGLLIVVGAAIGFAKYMKGYELDVTMMKTIKPAVMIQAGELITADMLREVSIPTVQHMDNAIVDGNEIVGKRAVVPIGEMEEFLSWKIGPDTLYPKKGETYIGFKVDFVGAVNNMIRRGDKVDVYVEYNTPKLLDAAGQVIDPTMTADPSASAMPQVAEKIYNEKLIPGLTVAYVKDQDGKEIVDSAPATTLGIPSTGSQRDEVNMERYRQGATAQPAFITFIISEEQYAKLAEGQKEGVIKLGLPLTSKPIGTIIPDKQTDTADPVKDTESEDKPVEANKPEANKLEQAVTQNSQAAVDKASANTNPANTEEGVGQ
ncbi:SAF domain-containing protein [Paenibacillus alkaliterrae]|uniref:SAF domain-containing protein n=1 Tax=Paenibacillus alkaliterrae TaxID=320909 RepID=UPI001F1D7C63|nr:SAF domain-containing protein [Paenibacillus alkaliterrae]MCF2940566.1 SAF domain-containing protein [Paenibacillus alkaliterrae]